MSCIEALNLIYTWFEHADALHMNTQFLVIEINSQALPEVALFDAGRRSVTISYIKLDILS